MVADAEWSLQQGMLLVPMLLEPCSMVPRIISCLEENKNDT